MDFFYEVVSWEDSETQVRERDSQWNALISKKFSLTQKTASSMFDVRCKQQVVYHTLCLFTMKAARAGVSTNSLPLMRELLFTNEPSVAQQTKANKKSFFLKKKGI